MQVAIDVDDDLSVHAQIIEDWRTLTVRLDQLGAAGEALVPHTQGALPTNS